MAEPTSDKHYEEEYKSPLWTLVKQRAEEKDCSYYAALQEVLPEYSNTIRYRDSEYEESVWQHRIQEMRELAEKEKQEGLFNLGSIERRIT